MRKRYQMDDTKKTSAYYFAQHLGFYLKEIAKNNGYNSKDIKVLSKKEIQNLEYGEADATVIWESGPTDWVYSLDTLNNPQDVSFMISNSYTLSFFNI